MLNKKTKAFTLAEVMVVLLAVSIIFAAFAPFITKRRLFSGAGKYSVWSFADKESYDAYAYTDSDATQEMFIGVTPVNEEAISTSFAPLSKLVIRSGVILNNKFQRQIQFRYGRTTTTDAGKFAGSWFMGNKNVLLGNTSYTTEITGKYNTSIGYGALGEIRTGAGNTALGYNALLSTSSGKNNVGIGYDAGSQITTADNNVFVGYSAGEDITGSKNVFIGYKSSGYGSGEASENTYVGAYSGYYTSGASKNVAIGYEALRNLRSGSHNIAIGSGALASLDSGSNNVAIGYNACRFVTGSNKTCIGAYSGPKNAGTSYGKKHYGSSLSTLAAKNLAAGDYLGGASDSVSRTYIGSSPDASSGFGGDAVLEIHNPTTTNSGLARLDSSIISNTTTIINGNLIVRGRPYFTVGSKLYHFTDFQLRDNKDTSSSFIYGIPDTSDTTTYKYYRQCTANQYTYDFGSASSTEPCYVTLTTSDRKLKNIGKKYVAGLDKISQLKVYNYNFKDDKTKSPRVGVIAQQLQKVFPSAVFKGEDGYLRIRWDEMFYAVINSIKELDDKLIAMAKRANGTENQISKLEYENSVLKSQIEDLTLRVDKLKNNK
jgi:hypothetical protein